MTPPATSREQMVKSMAALLHRQGYAATGLSQMLEHSGAPRGSLYFHFRGGKRELAIAALEYGAAVTASSIDKRLAGHTDVVTALDELAAYFGERLERSGWVLGCALATVALETSDDDAVAAACDDGFVLWTDRIAGMLVDAGLPGPEAQALATVTFSAWEGALILARARRSLEPLDQVRQHLASDLQRRLSA